MSRYIFDPEVYREKPVYGVIVEVIKDAKKQYYYSRSRELGKKEIEFVSDFLENRLEKKLNIQLSSVIIEKCKTIEDIINYVKFVNKEYGPGFYFDKTKMRK